MTQLSTKFEGKDPNWYGQVSRIDERRLAYNDTRHSTLKWKEIEEEDDPGKVYGHHIHYKALLVMDQH